MLRTISQEEADHIPCCFMSFSALRQRLDENRYEVAKTELEMGMDSMLFIPTASRFARKDHPDLRGLAVRFHPNVQTREWKEDVTGEEAVLHKEYVTPAGKLTTSVRLSEDWPHANHIPFIDDYQIPRSSDPLVSGPENLDALKFMLQPPGQEDLEAYRREAEDARRFRDAQGVMVAGGWGVGMDMANWLCGMQHLMVLMIEQPEFVDELLEIIHIWNKQRMQLVLGGGVDLYIRRAWYEGCDFVTPRFYKQSILPRLKAEVELAHEMGAKFGYICSSGTKPMLPYYREAGIDVLLGVDPIQGTHTDLPLMKEKIGDRVCLWGGVSGAVTVELGSEAEVRAAVRSAIDTLGPKGFILSPVDNITVDAPKTWENIDYFISEWKSYREKKG
jgi:uroporphyrinogen-III decarboxylase